MCQVSGEANKMVEISSSTHNSQSSALHGLENQKRGMSPGAGVTDSSMWFHHVLGTEFWPPVSAKSKYS